MIEIQGKPFLAYQIEQLRDQGFRKILLLLGYLPDVIQEYCGDGGRWGVSIEYSITAVENDTGSRLRLARPQLDSSFLLLYCDNYWPMQIDRMWPRFAASGATAMITVYLNEDGYTRNSVRVDPDGFVGVYDKTCAAPGLQGVEISYALMRREAVDVLPEANVSMEEVLYPSLVRNKQLLAHVTKHRYYSIGATHRLPLTNAFFERTPTVLLDRDGVLNRKPPQARYVRSWEEFEWLPGALEALRMLREAGYRVIVVSNQAGIGRGRMTTQDLESIHDRMKRDVLDAGGRIDAIYYCPHDWSAACACRKPKAGLLFQAQRDFSLDLTRTPFIGDDERDRTAADVAVCPFIAVTEERSLLDVTKGMLNNNDDEYETSPTPAGSRHRA
jgi:D-glycero-D-manno-heptose 1,7-bisphosphate phosphatase